MTTPGKPTAPAFVAPIASGISQGDMGFKGVIRVDGQLRYVPVPGWVTCMRQREHGPDWDFAPLFYGPRHWPVHHWNLSGFVCVVARDMRDAEVEAFVAQLDRERAARAGAGSIPVNQAGKGEA